MTDKSRPVSFEKWLKALEYECNQRELGHLDLPLARAAYDEGKAVLRVVEEIEDLEGADDADDHGDCDD